MLRILIIRTARQDEELLCLTLQGLVVLVLTLLPCMVTVWLVNVQRPNSLQATDCALFPFSSLSNYWV